MPVRAIAGQATKLSRTMHDIRYDPVNDEFLVGNSHAQAILVFAGGTDGDTAPIRYIQGPQTQLEGPDRLDVDTVHDEIFVPDRDRILVFPRKANGDVAPTRIIRGRDTQLRSAASVSVDPVNNRLVVGLNKNRDNPREPEPANGALLIFNRNDNGNVQPGGVIRGPRSGIIRITQMAVYPPRKLLIATQPGEVLDMEPENAFVGIWSLDDTGDVPPRWKIKADPKSTMLKPRGVVLDPKHKELIVADMRLNAVLTFYFPEIF